MAGDIFGNQDIGQGQSAIQAAQPISNTSKATAIEGLQYTDPLIGELARGAAKKSEEGNGDAVLNEFSRRLGDLEVARKTGGIKTSQELLNKQWQEAQRFKDYNPHLREDIDKIAKNSQEIYGFAKADVEAVAQEDAQKKLVTDIRNAGLIKDGEKDPAVIDREIVRWQSIQAAAAENKAINEQLDMITKKQTIAANQHTASGWERDDELKNWDLAKTRLEETSKNNFRTIISGGVSSVNSGINKVLLGIDGNPDDPNMRKNAYQVLEEQKNQTKQMLYQSPDFIRLDASARADAEKVLLEPITSTQELLKGDTSLKIIQNRVNEMSNEATYGVYTSSVGKEALKLSAAKSVLGENALSTVAGFETTSKLLLGDGATTPAGNPVPKSLFIKPKDPAEAKAYQEILSTPNKIAKKAQAAKEGSSDQKYYDKQMFDLTDTIMNGLVPGPNGELDPKSIQNALKELSRDDYNAWSVRYQPDYTDAVKEKVGTIIRVKHGEPAFAGAGAAMNTRMPGGKLASDYVQLVWQDSGIVAKSKVVNNQSDQRTVDIAIGEVNKIREGLSQIVKADATVQNSNDFQGVLDGYSKVFYGVENVSNTPVKGSTQTSVTNQMSTNAKNDLSYLTAQPEPAPAPVTQTQATTTTKSTTPTQEEIDNKIITLTNTFAQEGFSEEQIKPLIKSYLESIGMRDVKTQP